MSPRTIVVTAALPYANGPIHIGHLVEYLQTDIWVRYHKMCGNSCYYFCADDAHGTPIMISARKQGITPEELIDRTHAEHSGDFDSFLVEFDNYYSTHSPENREFAEHIYTSLDKAGSITKRNIEQAWCPEDDMALPDRFIRGICPKCQSPDQYGDSCDKCGATYQPTDLVDPKCATCGAKPISKQTEHYFFKLDDFEKQLRDLIAGGYIQKSVSNKLDEWFKAGLKDWDISRDGPYFGFKIPGSDDKYFYVWLDAPIGYMASAKNYCQKNGLDFDELWNSDKNELYHFIGKDIMYFHALFWPAMLMGAGFKTANKLFVHGFLTVNGEKMSKSKGTFIKASTFAKHIDPETLRYYYATKLTAGIEDIDLSFDDFLSKANSDLVGKFANLASRSGPMLTKKFDSTLSTLDSDGRELIDQLVAAKDEILADYESLNYASAMRKINVLADAANRFVEQKQPWATIKTDAETTQSTLTAVINAVRILTIYLKPVIPVFAAKVEKFLDAGDLKFADIETVLENRRINKFERLAERIEQKQVDEMTEESRQEAPEQPKEELQEETNTEPLAEPCTIEDFAKCDMRIARIAEAGPVEGADKLLQLKLDIGGIEKNVFAGIAKAYKPEDLVDRLVVCLANLQPRKMRFGISEAMVLAAGPGGEDIFIISPDSGAKPGQRVK